jgi:hypothetical protein
MKKCPLISHYIPIFNGNINILFVSYVIFVVNTWHFCGMFQLGHPFSLVPPEFFAGVVASLSQIRPLHFDNCRNGPKLVYDFPCLTIVFEEIYHIYISIWMNYSDFTLTWNDRKHSLQPHFYAKSDIASAVRWTCWTGA